MKRLQFCLAVFAVLALTFSAFAQVQNGQFTGTVTDPTGAAIANAKITVTNPAIDLNLTTTTNSSGNYTVKEVPIGTYKLTVEAPGFKSVSNNGVQANAGTIAHVDFKLQIGKASEVIEVTGAAAAVNTEDSKLASTVTSAQIANLPLNGRNVYDLIQMAPGAVNVNGVDFENGHGTVVNGLREDFNGFLINGVSNKGLSGGVNNTPIQDTVQEFQQLQLNMSAQYGNSAGSTTNLVTKSGTNAFHGSLWEYNRNDKFDANEYFLNQQLVKKPALRFNQFGGTIGGPIIKDKLFFFGSYQGDRFTTVGTPQTVTQESPQWEQAVIAADTANNTSSVAGLLYKNFAPGVAGSAVTATMDDYVLSGGSGSTGFSSYVDYLCPDSYVNLGGSAAQGQAIAARMATILGVLPTDNFTSVPSLSATTPTACSSTPGQQAGTIGRTAAGSTMPFQVSSIALFKSQSQTLGNLFNGNEASARFDYNWNNNNRFYANFNWYKQTDTFGPCDAACARGFTNPQKLYFPNGQLSYVRTFSPTVLNEFRAGYTANKNLIKTATPGVPDVNFDDTSLGFGSYNGYPQSFKENVYTYSDMVSISHGNHNLKIGADFRRNIENSEFNVARPSYYFFDPLFFAADAPYSMAAGVNPDLCKAPCAPSNFNSNPNGFLESNVRHWRNLEVGAYFQDDWKVTKRLTLNLGLRYDLFTRHHEENNLATTFIPGPGSNILAGVISANNPANCLTPSQMALAQLVGECGPGGFAPAKGLGKGDHNNLGPRVGFAWDVMGDGRTSLRGGFGVSYEGTLYNPLSNSRWNLPYYSFNFADNALNGDVNTVIYGPTTCTATSCAPSGAKPTFTGPATNPGQGIGAQATGNLTGWAPFNPNVAILTGIVLPEGIKDPYVYGYHFGVQHEIMPKMVLEVNYVGTTAHKLFRAENINRHPGSVLKPGACITDNFGRNWCGNGGFANNDYGNLRNWRNVVNSNYNSLQTTLKKQMSHGLLFNVNYTYSHAIDNGSTWHSGATTANGAAAGEGYTTDLTLPGLDRGDSVFDIRHRLVLNYVWQLPGQNLKGVMGVIAGGWSLNGIWSFQTGAHWEPFTSSGRRLREITKVDPANNPKGFCEVSVVIDGSDDFTDGNCHNVGGDFNLDRGS